MTKPDMVGKFCADCGKQAAILFPDGSYLCAMCVNSQINSLENIALRTASEELGSAPRPPFGPPRCAGSRPAPRVWLPGKLENRYHSRQFGRHLGNVGIAVSLIADFCNKIGNIETKSANWGMLA